MNRHKQIIIAIATVLLVIPIVVSAQVPINVSYPSLGGLNPAVDQTGPAIIAWFYYFGIALGAFLAILVIAYGGFQYIMSFGNPATADEGKDKIKMAIYGFVLLLVAIVALNTINPGIFSTFTNGIALQPQVLNVTHGGGGGTPPPPTIWSCEGMVCSGGFPRVCRSVWSGCFPTQAACQSSNCVSNGGSCRAAPQSQCPGP